MSRKFKKGDKVWVYFAQWRKGVIREVLDGGGYLVRTKYDWGRHLEYKSEKDLESRTGLFNFKRKGKE